jgi:hypothetical protein
MGLGGEHELVALARDELAQDGLGLAPRIDVGGVEEVDAGVAAALVEGARRGLIGFAAEGHRAEAQLRHLNTRVPERAIVHAVF